MYYLLKVFVLRYGVAKTTSPIQKKNFEVYSSYIMVASNIFKQTKTLIDKGSVLWFIS